MFQGKNTGGNRLGEALKTICQVLQNDIQNDVSVPQWMKIMLGTISLSVPLQNCITDHVFC